MRVTRVIGVEPTIGEGLERDSLHRRGLTSFLDVLDAERGLYESELRLAESEAASSLNVVSLYKALGGGWQTEG